MLFTIASAIGLFAATNIDDFVVLTLFFLAVQRGAIPTWKVVAGQYTGVIALIVLSLTAGLGLTLLPAQYVGVLGLIPLALGVRGLIRYARSRSLPKEIRSSLNPGGIWGVIGITLANGGDNIAVYTPVFRVQSAAETTITVTVFVLLIGVWVALARLVTGRPRVLHAVERVETWLVPTVFCVLGVLIIVRSGLLT